jgi:hypothetical protein
MFDPYHKWLGISSKDQPPNHYRLLGIDLFEADPDVIDTAANKQMAFVQGCATGPHLALSQKLLNEIAAARLSLLNKAKKAAYDAKLKAKMVPPAAAAGVELAVVADVELVPLAPPPAPAKAAPMPRAAPANQPVLADLAHQMGSAAEEESAPASRRRRRGRHRSHNPLKWPAIFAGVALGVGLVVFAVVYFNSFQTSKVEKKTPAKKVGKRKGADGPTKATAEPPRIVGRFRMTFTGPSSGSTRLEFTKDHEVVSDGKPIGTWESDEGTITVVYRNKQYGTATLKFQDDNTLIGINVQRGKVTYRWVLKREGK